MYGDNYHLNINYSLPPSAITRFQFSLLTVESITLFALKMLSYILVLLFDFRYLLKNAFNCTEYFQSKVFL